MDYFFTLKAKDVNPSRHAIDARVGFVARTIVPHLVLCITCFQSGLDPIGASTNHFVGRVVLWKQMIRCT